MVRAANQVNRRHIPCYCYHPTRSYIISCQQILKLRHHRTVFLLPHTRARTPKLSFSVTDTPHHHHIPSFPFFRRFFESHSNTYQSLPPTNVHLKFLLLPSSKPPNHANIILIYLFLYRRVFSDHTSSWRAALPASLLTALHPLSFYLSSSYHHHHHQCQHSGIPHTNSHKRHTPLFYTFYLLLT